MDIKQLAYFIEVVKEKSFTKAASNCFISQPALSKSMKQLEAELNAKLFNRNTRTVEITKEGSIIYNEAIEILHNFKRMQQKLEYAQFEQLCSITLAVSPILSELYFNKLLLNFCLSNQNLSIDINEKSAHNIFDDIDSKSYDMAITFLANPMSDYNSIYKISSVAHTELVTVSKSPFHKISDSLSIITIVELLHIFKINNIDLSDKNHLILLNNLGSIKLYLEHSHCLAILPKIIIDQLQLSNQYHIESFHQIICSICTLSQKHADNAYFISKIENYIDASLKKDCSK